MNKKEILQLFGVFLGIYLLIFGYKTGKTLLSEINPINPSYVLYTDCISAGADDGFPWRQNCDTYKTGSKLLVSRIWDHATSSLLVPLLLLIILALGAYGVKKGEQRSIEYHKNDKKW